MSDLAAAIVETMAQPVLVLEKDLRVAAANPAFLETFKVDRNGTVGEYLHELGNGQWNITELRWLLAELLEGRERFENFRVDHEFQSIGRRTILLSGRNLAQAGYDRILLAINDVTERERIEGELAARSEFADKLIDSIREGLVVLRRDLSVEQVNQSFCEMFAVEADEAEGHLIYEIGDSHWDIPGLRTALEEVLPNDSSFDDYEVTGDFPNIGRRTMLLNARRLDHMPNILLAIRDETEIRKSTESQKLLIGELQHRVKNILANVQSIATATLRRSRTIEEFWDAYILRIQSLSRAQDLLLRAPDGSSSIRELLTNELSAHGWEEDGRLTFEGPSASLSRRQTQPLAMVIHELATNAVKYGAFSGPKGRLDIAWSVDPERQLHLDWVESGVERPEPPGKNGFGMGMIGNSVRYMLGGETRLAFDPDGLTCRISFPLAPEAR